LKNRILALTALSFASLPATAREVYPLPSLLKPVMEGVSGFELDHYEAYFVERNAGGATRGVAPNPRSLKSYKQYADEMANASPEQKRCFWILASGGETCPSESEVAALVSSVDEHTDLLVRSREIAQRHGMRVARDFLAAALLAADETRGGFEARVLETTKDKTKVFDDSILRLSSGKRGRIGIYFVAGYNHNRGVSAAVMDAAAEHLRKLGFQSERLIVGAADSAESNAVRIRKALEVKAKGLDSILLVGLSKGVSDVSRFVVSELPLASENLQSRVKVLVSLSGVARDAFVPSWLSRQKGLTTAAIRAWMKQYLPDDHRNWDGLESMATDYWKGYRYPGKKPPLWISFPMIPESERGMPERKGVLRMVTSFVTKADETYGPHDGLVETGASILPPGTGLRQWIIRAMGDHGLIDGTYVDGSPVSYAFEASQDNIKAGIELIDAFARALPDEVLR